MKISLVTGVLFFCFTMISVVFAQESPKLMDSEIAYVAVVANQNDIDFAKIALKKSKDENVLKFAQAMVADHQAVIDMAVELVTKLGVTPKESDVSKQYQASAMQTQEMLNSKSGKAFDQAYVTNEVNYHKAVISAIESVLIPQTVNAELKALLGKALPILEAHLHHAEMVQRQMR